MTLSWKKKYPVPQGAEARTRSSVFRKSGGAPAPQASLRPEARAGAGGRSSVGTSPQPSTFKLTSTSAASAPASSTHSVHIQRSCPPPTPARRRGLPGWGGQTQTVSPGPRCTRLHSLLLSLCCCTRALSSCVEPQGSFLDGDFSPRWLSCCRAKALAGLPWLQLWALECRLRSCGAGLVAPWRVGCS